MLKSELRTQGRPALTRYSDVSRIDTRTTLAEADSLVAYGTEGGGSGCEGAKGIGKEIRKHILALAFLAATRTRGKLRSSAAYGVKRAFMSRSSPHLFFEAQN